jgi:hypothetical protein
MKTIPKVIGTLILVLFGTLASGAAMAQHHGHGGGNVRFGISLGFPIFGPAYYPAPYYGYPYAYAPYAYPAPAYAYPPAADYYSSPAYADQSATYAAPAPSQAQGDWYYCAASNSYYPYATECPAGWQRVPAQPLR